MHVRVRVRVQVQVQVQAQKCLPSRVHTQRLLHLGGVDALPGAQQGQEGQAVAAGGRSPEPRLAAAGDVQDLLQPLPHPQGVDGRVPLVRQQDGDGVELGGVPGGLPVGGQTSLDVVGSPMRPAEAAGYRVKTLWSLQLPEI